MAEDQQGALGELPKLCHEVCCRKIHPLSSVTYPIFTDSFQNCDSQELRVATSRSGYPKKRTLPLTEDFCLIVAKMRKICKDPHRKKAFEDHYTYETPLTGGDGHLRCDIVEGGIHFKPPSKCNVHLFRIKTQIFTPRSQSSAPLYPSRWAEDSLQPRLREGNTCKSSRGLA